MEGGNKIEEPVVRDGEYYIDSADCVILVENTLFKVHSYFLGREASAFQDMFNMPAGTQDVEGCSDENPVRLHGESTERFRVLISVIYGTPLQFQAYNTRAADVERLLTIAEMTNKYRFTSLERWALDTLYNVISGLHGPPQAQYDLGRCSSQWMKRLSDVALLCGDSTLLSFVTGRWVERIVARDLRPIHAFDIAERNGIRNLQGYAYYVQLLEMDDDFEPRAGVVEDGKSYSHLTTAPTVSEPNGNVATVASSSTGTPASLTREQRERLLVGYWSLSRLWDRLSSNPPDLQQPEECTVHQRECVPSWIRAWKSLCQSEEIREHSIGDVLGRLEVMDRLFKIGYLDSQMYTVTSRCKRGAYRALQAVIKEVQDGLVDYFALPRSRKRPNGTESAS